MLQYRGIRAVKLFLLLFFAFHCMGKLLKCYHQSKQLVVLLQYVECTRILVEDYSCDSVLIHLKVQIFCVTRILQYGEN